MRIEGKKHPLNRGLRGFFVIDVTRVFVFDRGNGFAIVVFDPVGLVLVFERNLSIVDLRRALMHAARAQATGDAGSRDYDDCEDGEVSIHRNRFRQTIENIAQSWGGLRSTSDMGNG